MTESIVGRGWTFPPTIDAQGGLALTSEISELEQAIQIIVEEALGMWEPRIRVTEVNIGPDPDADNRLLIAIEYELKSTHDKRSLVYPFYLIPEE
jgi:phage baseplate assembly protein W